jgi:hypothetical protein
MPPNIARTTHAEGTNERVACGRYRHVVVAPLKLLSAAPDVTNEYHMPVDCWVYSLRRSRESTTSRCMHLPAGSAPLLACPSRRFCFETATARRYSPEAPMVFLSCHGGARTAVDGSSSFRQADRSVSLQATVLIWFGPASVEKFDEWKKLEVIEFNFCTDFLINSTEFLVNSISFILAGFGKINGIFKP